MDNNMKKVKTVLQRYSFDSKMTACQYYSLKNISYNGVDIEEGLGKFPAPWYLETIVLLSINYGNWKNDVIDKTTFIKVVNDLHSVNILEKSSEENIMRDFFLSTAAIQFRIQRSLMLELYRYNYYFSYCDDNLDIKKEFNKRYGCNYFDFSLFSYSIWMLLLLKKNHSDEKYNRKVNEVIQKLSLKYDVPFKNLSIDYHDYKNILKSMNLNLDDFYSVTRPSYAFPFILKDNVIYLPVPHLLIIASTEFLMTRLTENNNKLRINIGNVVYENYLYDVLYDSSYFDEIYKEQSYIYRKNKMKTIDVMCRVGKDVLFFDRKSTIPGWKISIADEKDIAHNIDVMGKACAQMYRHLKLKYSVEYNPFNDKFVASDDNRWGIVVVELDSFIMRQYIYNKAKELLMDDGIENIDYEWMTKHIVITDIQCIERFYFYNPENFLMELKDRAIGNKINNFITNNRLENCNLQNKKVIKFVDDLSNPILKTLIDLF